MDRAHMHRIGILVALALGGCRPPEAKPTVAPTTETPRDAAPPEDDGMLPVTLVDSGKAPHHELRIAPVVGAREELRMTIEHDVERLDGHPVYGDTPASTVLVDLVVEPSDPGTYRFGFLVGWATAEGARPFARGEMLVDERARLLDYAIEFGTPDADGQLQPLQANVGIGPEARAIEQLGRFLVPLPAEAVGVGAKWTTEETAEDGGLSVTIVSTYELVAARPEGVEIRVTEGAQLDGGDVTGPGPATKLNKLRIDGKRTAFLATGFVMPRQESALVNEIDIEQQGERMALRTTESVALRPLEESELAAFSPEDAMLLQFGTPSPALCRSLRGDRNGRFPRESGAARLVGECVAGKMNGTWTAWHEGGAQKSVEGQFDAGVPVGRWTQWSTGGKEIGTFELKAGTGTARAWWPNGQKRLEVELDRGVPDGALATWHEDGKPDVRGRFVDGLRDGRWEQLDAAGKVVDFTTNDHKCRVVASVVPDSAAARAEVKEGDIVTALGKTKIADADTLRTTTKAAKDGPTTLVVLREGKTVKLKPKLEGGKLGVQLACRLHSVTSR